MHDGTVPVEIADDPAAVAFWNRYVPVLIGLGAFRVTDEPKFVVICVAWSEFWSNRTALMQARTQTSGANGRVATPENALARGWAHELNQMLAEYGFSPSARAKLGGGSTVPNDPLAEHLRQRPQVPRPA
jgi:phage terminase small subunit